MRKHRAIRKSGKRKGTLKVGWRYKKGGQIVKAKGIQRGTKSVYKRDEKRKAKKPGRRTSKSGRKYTERRRNRSDASRKKRV